MSMCIDQDHDVRLVAGNCACLSRGRGFVARVVREDVTVVGVNRERAQALRDFFGHCRESTRIVVPEMSVLAGA
jgi:hypothetical protein